MVDSLHTCSEFTSKLFDESYTKNSLVYYKPDFSQLPLIPPPPLLITGKLKINFLLFEEFDLRI